MKIKFIKRWGVYCKGHEFDGRFYGLRDDYWHFHNLDNGEDLVGIPGGDFVLSDVDFDPHWMTKAIHTNNFLAYEWERIEHNEINLHNLFNKLITGNHVAEREYLKSSLTSIEAM